MKFRLIAVLISLCFTNPVTSQSSGPEIGKFPYFRPGEKTVLFIDGDIGEIYGFASFEESIWDVTLADEDDFFYAMSRNYIYKAQISTGEIMDKYEAMEVLEQKPEDLTDPNLNIMPYGVSPNGKALFSYNKELFELQSRQSEVLKAMNGASMTEINKLSKESSDITNKMTPLYTKQETYVGDLAQKSTAPFKDYDINANMLFALNDDGQVQTYNKATKKLIFTDVNTGEVTQEYDVSGIYKKIPELNALQSNPPIQYGENLFGFTFFNGTTGGFGTLYDIEKDELPLYYEFSSAMESSYPLFYQNSDVFRYATKSCDIGPMPPMPDFGQPDGYSKKKVAEWKEKMEKMQVDHQKALKEWQDKATNPENCNVTIYKGTEMDEVLFEVERSVGGTIYNNKYLLVGRNFEFTLYDIETGETVWTVDTDF